MKRLFYVLLIAASIVCNYACETDNYDGPDAQISGRILDHHGNPLQVEQGADNTQIKTEDLSWSESHNNSAITPIFLNMKQDGSYSQKQWFSGKYKMTPVRGPFYPYDDKEEIVMVKGHTTMDFTVIPYLDIEWVREPYVTADNYIAASIRFKRNKKEGANMPNLNNALFCIATTQYVGNNNYDKQLVSGTIAISNSQEGETIELKTSRAVKYTGMTYYVRAGVCCSDFYKKYNYTDIKEVKVP